MKLLADIFILVLIFSCTTEKTETIDYFEENQLSDYNDDQETFNLEFEERKMKTMSVATYKDVQYRLMYVDGFSFVKRKGEEIDKQDKEALKEETVFFLEFSSKNSSKRNPLDLEQGTSAKESLIEYLAFQVLEDITIEQGDSIYTPNDLLFERDFGISDRLRVMFFFNQLNRNKTFKVNLNDRAFGAGNIKFNYN